MTQDPSSGQLIASKSVSPEKLVYRENLRVLSDPVLYIKLIRNSTGRLLLLKNAVRKPTFPEASRPADMS